MAKSPSVKTKRNKSYKAELDFNGMEESTSIYNALASHLQFIRRLHASRSNICVEEIQIAKKAKNKNRVRKLWA